MASQTDNKLARLAAAGLCLGTATDLREVGRLGDLAVVADGTVLAHEGSHEPWSYFVMSGAALLSAGDAPVAVAGAGCWLLGHVPGREHHATPYDIVAGTDLEVLAFRPRDLGAALRLDSLRLAG
jgi:hypothetical protein